MNRISFWLTLSVFLSFTINLKAQDICSCQQNLDSLIKSVEENYVGYSFKAKQPNYSRLKATIRARSKGQVNFDCFLLMKEYLAYFKDPHLDIHLRRPKDGSYDDILKSMFKSLPKEIVSVDQLKSYFNGKGIDQIEGIWEAKEFPFKMAIYKSKRRGIRYVGVTIDADSFFYQPGDTKVEIPDDGWENHKMKYYANDHYPTINSFQIEGNRLIISGMSTWTRVLPTTPDASPVNTQASFQKLEENVNLLTIRTFNISNKALVDSLVGSNINEIKGSKYLLIDLRNNGGGHIMTCDTLIPLLYTNPIARDGFVLKSSKDNIGLYKKQLENPNFSDADKASFQRLIDKMEAKPGEIVKISGPDTLTYDQVSVYPQKIGILVNEGTASTSELFLFYAKQSKKVTIFGSNTKGALDHTETGGSRKLTCPYLSYICPMGMSEHVVLPYIDNIGIAPHVKIGLSERNWIDFAQQYLMTH